MNLDRTLENFAVLEPDEAAVESAQHRLEALIAARAPRVRRAPRMRGWLTAVATACVVAVALIWMPLGPTPALAFSAVQQQLRDFTTLRFVLDQRVNGREVMQTRVAMTRDGNVRTEVGDDITVIVNSTERRVLTLMKSRRMGYVTPLENTVQRDDQLSWLEDIREFQGAATPLSKTRFIRGHRAYGWKLDIEGAHLELWATEEGVPLEMNMDQGKVLQMEFEFEMNPPLAAGLFSTQPPEGYTLGVPDED